MVSMIAFTNPTKNQITKSNAYNYVESKHPPKIIKPNSKVIKKRLTKLSCNKEILNESTPFYEDKLQQSGYQ